MSKELVGSNIVIKGLKKDKPKLKSTDGFILNFYQNGKTLKNLDDMNKFIKGVEKLVRKSRKYDHYINYLIETMGFNHCMVLSHITTEMAPIEMHHGPILTLYDICLIVTNYYIHNKCKNITTFKIAKKVLEEHYNNNVQVVMLSEVAHKMVHNNDMYINPKQAWGNLNEFLIKYKDGIDDYMYNIINENLEIARKYASTDKQLLDLNKKVTNWSNI